jgi:quinol monooxygenase YgiN
MVRTRLTSTLHETLVATRGFEGCKSVEIYLDQDNADVIVLWEKWESRAHSEKYFAWRVATGLLQELSVVLAAPAQIWHFDEVGN